MKTLFTFRSKTGYACLFLLIALIGLGLERTYNYLNDGFYVSYIYPEFSHRENWQPPLQTSLIETQVKEILNQKFTYLGKGAQFYAFESADGQYVLKIVKQKHTRASWWEQIPLKIASLEKSRVESLNRKQKRIQQLLESVKLSYEELPEETGIIYVHLTPTNHLNTKLIFFDKIGFKYTFEADNSEFILQKKATPLLTAIDKAMSQNNLAGAVAILQKIRDLYCNCAAKGIVDKDKAQTALMRNLGILQNKVIFIDVGLLSKDPEIINTENINSDIMLRSKGFISWIQKNHPILTPYYINILEE